MRFFARNVKMKAKWSHILVKQPGQVGRGLESTSSSRKVTQVNQYLPNMRWMTISEEVEFRMAIKAKFMKPLQTDQGRVAHNQRKWRETPKQEGRMGAKFAPKIWAPRL